MHVSNCISSGVHSQMCSPLLLLLQLLLLLLLPESLCDTSSSCTSYSLFSSIRHPLPIFLAAKRGTLLCATPGPSGTGVMFCISHSWA